MSQRDAADALRPPDREALVALLLSWADDELILGHRDSEWTGFAPQIEEDVAFSSIAQDEIAHAAELYRLIAELTGDDPDRLALRRDAAEYRHAAALERPNGDWAHTIARHYLYDLADQMRIDAVCDSTYGPLAAVAGKMGREEHYHRMHGAAWWDRMREGSGESRARLASATRSLLPDVAAVFGATPGADDLVAAGILSCPLEAAFDEWRLCVEPLVSGLDAGLARFLGGTPPAREPRPVGEAFAALYADLTMVSASGLGERW